MLLSTSLLLALAVAPPSAPPPRYDASIQEARIVVDAPTRRAALVWTLGLSLSRDVPALPLRLAVWELGPGGERLRLVGEARYDTKAEVNCPNVNFCSSPMSACSTPAGGCQVSVNGACQTGVCDPEGDGTGRCGEFSCLCKVESKPCTGGKETMVPVLGGRLDIGNISKLRMELFPCPGDAPLDPETGACDARETTCHDCVDVDPTDNVRTVTSMR